MHTPNMGEKVAQVSEVFLYDNNQRITSRYSLNEIRLIVRAVWKPPRDVRKLLYMLRKRDDGKLRVSGWRGAHLSNQ